ncbi:hypothetical protein ROA7450_03383 [Roseovarius albus]|uniref:Uncharacterized protein n=1 Tax=Roseovarius albus TaxID=1247867 RepID=A0A1X6ZXT6_9RHOB|nr:hypothetical protein [Roseovarius albus]SLN64126.1 hypothetical protein ROA7450_03383 [Roseovarius albus]
MKCSDGKPPRGTRRVYGWKDLPDNEQPTHYHVIDRNGHETTVSAKGKKKRVLEGLRRAPLLSASYCRLSDQVDLLRRAGLDIETTLYKNDPETGRERYGVYTLHGSVSPIRGDAA